MIRTVLVAACVAVGSVAAAAPAGASGTNGPLCELVSNAVMYDRPLGNPGPTVHRGYHFRVHGWQYDTRNRLWAYGHSGENPDRDGWVLDYHVYCA